MRETTDELDRQVGMTNFGQNEITNMLLA